MDGERESRESVLSACLDDDDNLNKNQSGIPNTNVHKTLASMNTKYLYLIILNQYIKTN